MQTEESDGEVPVETPTFEASPGPAPGMAESWNRRAAEDPLFYIASGSSLSEAEFARSGEDDVEDVILPGIALDPSADVLEIGCGIGRLLVPLARRAASVRGVDISAVMIEKSKAYCAAYPNVSTSVTSGTLDEIPDASVDLVFSFIVFQHIPDRAAIATYVAEAARVLRAGGVLRFQVDGRAGGEGRADTYDGVKLSRRDVTEMVAAVGLDIRDDWGEDTHYHWTTARKGGEAQRPRVRILPRAFDPVMVEDLLVRCGAANASDLAARVVARETSLRSCLRGLDAMWPGDDALFVHRVYELVLGRPTRDEELAFHLRVLSRGWDVRSSVVDSVLASREARDLLSPVVHGMPWPFLENAAGALSLKALRAFEHEPFRAAELVARALANEGDAVAAAYRAVRGREPDETARRYHAASTLTHPAGPYLLVRRLLDAPDEAVAPPPPRDGAIRLAPLAGTAATPSSTSPGESFPGERLVARAVLDAGERLPDRAFVAKAYETILGREADAEGAEYYAGRLERGELGRPAFLRDLLWSDELRRTGDAKLDG